MPHFPRLPLLVTHTSYIYLQHTSTSSYIYTIQDTYKVHIYIYLYIPIYLARLAVHINTYLLNALTQ